MDEENVSVSLLERVQLDMLRSLKDGLFRRGTNGSSQLGAAKMFEAAVRDAGMNPEVSRFDQVVEVDTMISKAIKRAEGQKFSIAFCGMVKAGCVVP